MSALLDKALSLLEKGLHVFPLGSYGEPAPEFFVRDRFDGDQAKADKAWPKQPRLSWKAFQFAAPTEETVRSWWARWPNANIGIACGALVVVDADSDDAVAWCRKNLPSTPWLVKTGKGSHFYYRANPDCEIRNSADPLAKIDTRGLGGYVVSGGSRHSSGAFYLDEIDPELNNVTVGDLPMLTKEHVDAIGAYRAQNIGASAPLGGGNLAGFDAGKIRAAATGEPVKEGGRNDAAASLVGQHIRSGLSLRDTKKLLDGWNACNPQPLSDSEINTTIASVKATHERNHPGQSVPLESPTRRAVHWSVRRIVPKFPRHLLNPPGLVGEIAAYMTRTAIKPQPVLSLAASLTLCGAIMGRKVRTPSDLRTNVYTLGIGASGSGKEHPRKAIKRLLHAADAMSILVAETLASDAGLFNAVFKSPACIVMTDEIGRFLKTATGRNAPPHLVAIVTSLLQLSGSADAPFMEKVRAEVRDADCRVIDQPCVSLMGSTVPESLFDSLRPEDVTNGFLPRLLPFYSDDPDPANHPVTDKTPPPEMIALVRKWATRPVNAHPAGNLDIKPNPLRVDFSPDAQIVFVAFDAANRIRKADTRGSGLDAMWSRADEHAQRLALIVASGRNFDNPMIDQADAEWACELVKFLYERTILEIDDKLGENEHELNVKKVMSIIRKRHPDATPRWELGKKLKGLTKVYLTSIIETLVENREIVALAIEGAGRPGVGYSLAPS